MAFRQYPDNIVVVICNGPPTVIDLGSPTPDDNWQLEVIRIQMFKFGDIASSVRMRVNAYIGAVPLGSSLWQSANAIDIEYDATDYFYGWLKFTFDPRINFLSSAPTRLELELENYVFSEAAWLAVVLDWPITMGYNDDPDQIRDAPVAMELYGAV